ncbi:hypothetical protein [Vibrio nigripulchritudo]|uniref:hypothetical protein n=1 Tax=Vibrio nigripulchritudo TaxID=28173 RepID=UPI0005FA4D73|nr:hypothetical protein [Vibrio nigripulchritudo]KJY69753.1 hypothetical protein TW74_23910 [Vibrio nigripulchritudo]
MLNRIFIITISCIFVLWLNTAYAENEKYPLLDKSCSSIVCKHSIEDASLKYDKDSNLKFSSENYSNMDKVSSSLYIILDHKENKNNDDLNTILDVLEVWER